jgi:hypothetical protein
LEIVKAEESEAIQLILGGGGVILTGKSHAAMGTRINVIVEHHFRDYLDRAATIKMLMPTVSAATEVANYWRTVDPEYKELHPNSWTASPRDPLGRFLMYYGPGILFLKFGSKLARIWTGARWRGFLSIEPLRRVHLQAFRNIAQHLGSERMVFFPDGGIADDLVPAAIHEGITQEECIARLQRAYGAPQPSIDNVAPEIVAETKRTVPSVWYIEAVK